MNVVLDPVFLKKLKNLNVRIRKNVKEKILLFSENPHDLQLNNHLLREPYLGCRSIDITTDYRAVYEEKHVGNEITAHFIILGTHEELYKNEIN